MSAFPTGRLAAALDAQLALDHAVDVRMWRVHVVALLSVPLGVVARWPNVGSELGRRAVLSFWVLAAAGAVWAAVEEWQLRRRLSTMAHDEVG